MFDSDSRKAVVQELESLKKLSGCYFEFLDRLSKEDGRMVVVFYFEDSLINAKAEQMKLTTQLKTFACSIPFRVAAKKEF